MTLPSTITVKPSGNQLKGIIDKLMNTYQISDPVASNIVVPSSVGDYVNSAQANVKTIVLKDKEYYGTTWGAGAWIQLTFPNRFIFPTAYSLKSTTGSWSYAKAWNVYGIHAGDENKDVSKWDLLGSNRTSESIYCNPADRNGRCTSTDVGTFTLKPMPSRIGYRHIRWVATEGCETNAESAFATSGVDVYGSLSMIRIINKQKTKNVFKMKVIKSILIAASENAVMQK